MDFGHDVDRDLYLQDIISKFSFTTRHKADKFLKLHYETYFGAYDHRAFFERNKRAPVAMSKHAGNSRPLDEKYLPLFHDFEETKELHNLNLLEYMQLPRTTREDLTRQMRLYLVRKAQAQAPNNNIIKKQEEALMKELSQLTKT